MNRLFTRFTDRQKAKELASYIVREAKYEGIFKDSFADCGMMIENTMNEHGCVYVGVNTYRLVVGGSEESMLDHGCICPIGDADDFKELLSVCKTKFEQERMKAYE